MNTKPNAIESETFNHHRIQEQRKTEAIKLLNDDGYIIYKRSTKSPRIYNTLGI